DFLARAWRTGSLGAAVRPRDQRCRGPVPPGVVRRDRQFGDPVGCAGGHGQPDADFLPARLEQCLPGCLDAHPARAARQHPSALQFRDPVSQAPISMKDDLLDFDRAQALLAQAAKPLTRLQLVALADAVGRVLAVDMSATLDLPPADNSAMDGYAIRHADYRPDVVLPVQQRCYAGDMPQPSLPGQATRLFTGSLIPEGADTVVIQENTRETDGQVQI